MEIKIMNKKINVLAFVVTTLFISFISHAEDRPMGFFVTSVGMGNGADLGGLKGADAHCQKLAAAVGAGDRDWKAYLSTEEPKKRGVFARNRIGNGPWYNARGILIATNPTDLHLYNKTITLETALDESGNRIKGRYDKPNEHDILTRTTVPLTFLTIRITPAATGLAVVKAVRRLAIMTDMGVATRPGVPPMRRVVVARRR
jgi:hypothetical protein